MTEALDLHVWVADGSLRLSLDGALVVGTTARLRTWMEAHVPATADRLVLDLSGLVAIDAVGLGALLAAHRRLAPGAQVDLCGARPDVLRTLRNAGLLALPRQEPAQQVSRTAPTMADVTTSTSDGLLTNGGIA